MASPDWETLNVSEDNIKSWIIHGLHSMRLIPLDQDILDLQVGGTITLDQQRLVPLQIKKEAEVTIVRHNEK